MCDTFIALPDATLDGSVIFAKNSDRPAGEAQTSLVNPALKYDEGGRVQCTYIDIPQIRKTQAVLLSRIDWMWGAEMGANEAGVIIGNEAVWTNISPGPAALLGMDLVRLGLERSGTARQALDVMTTLLEIHGQGGACAQNDPSFTYDNSFMIADLSEAFVLETAGKNWVAKRLKNGTGNISNRLSLRTNYDLSSAGMDGADFAARFSEAPLEVEPCSREHWGAQYLAKNSGQITPGTMKEILRDHQSGICMHGGFETTASMITQLYPGGKMSHWVMDEPHPCTGEYRLVEDFG